MKLYPLAFLFLCPLFGLSQQDSILNIELSETIVTGKINPSNAGNSLQKISIIGQKEIKQSSAQTLSDILNYQLGIRVSNDVNIGSSSSLNGIGTRNIKILIDGVPFVGGLNGGADLSQINLNAVERIEIIEGSNAILFGNNSLGGVINIITKKSEKSRTSLNSYVESVQRYNVNVSNQFKLGKGYYLNNFIAHNYFNGFSRPDTSRVDQWKPKENIQFNIGLKKNFGAKAEMQINSINSFEKLIDRGSPFNSQQTLAEDYYYSTYNFLNSLKYKRFLNNRSNFVLFFSDSRYYRSKKSFIKDLTTLEKQSSNKIFIPNQNNSFNINANYFYSLKAQSQLQIGTDVNLQNASGEKIKDGIKYQNSYGVFVVPEFNFLDKKLGIKPGFRFNYVDNYYTPLLASLNIKYSPISSLNFRMGIANGYRVPSLSELYFEFIDNNHMIVGNPDLKSESAMNMNFSADYFFGKGSILNKLMFTSIYNSIDNLISLIQYEPLKFRYYNISSMKSFSNGLSYSMQRSNFNYEIGLNYNQIYVPEYNNGNIIPNYQYKFSGTYIFERQNIFLNAIYKYDKNLPQFTQVDDKVELSKSAGINIFDANVSKRFKDNKFELSLGVKNIFDLVSINSGTISSSNPHNNGGNNLIGTGRTYFINLLWNIRNEK